MLKWLGGNVEKRPGTIIILVILVTAGFLSVLPGLAFETELSQFMPDSPTARANEKVIDYFGEEPYLQLVYVTEDNENNSVLTPQALREQYNLTVVARDIDGVLETQSLADIFNILVKYEINYNSKKVQYNENITLAEASNGRIMFWMTMLQGVMNGSVDANFTEEFGGGNSLIGSVSPEDVSLLFELFLSKDFNNETMTASSTFIIIKIDGTITRTEARTAAGSIKEAIHDVYFFEIEEKQTGENLIAYEVEQNLPRNAAVLAVGITVLTTLILYSSFKKFSYVIMPMLTLLIAIIWTFGAMVLFGKTFTIIDMAVIPLVVGLGVDYSVHVSRRYNEELRNGRSVIDSLKITIEKVGMALLLALATTVVAFLSNLSSTLPPIREFGVMCGLGIFFAFFLTITFYPSVRFILDRKKSDPLKSRKVPWVNHAMARMYNGIRKAKVAIIAVVILGSILSVVAIPSISTEFNMETFLPSDWESIKTEKELRSELSAGSYTQVYILIEDDMATTDALHAISRTMENAGDDSFVINTGSGASVGAAQSVITLIQRMVLTNSTIMDTYNFDGNGLPNAQCQDSDVRALFQYMVQNTTVTDPLAGTTVQEYFHTFVHEDEDIPYSEPGRFDAGVIRITASSQAVKEGESVKNQLKEDVKPLEEQDIEFRTTGNLVMVIQTMEALQMSQITSTALSVLFAFITLLILYRSPILSGIALIPISFTIIWVLGTMVLLDIELNILTIMVTALTVGLGIDYAIHVIERFREETKRYPRPHDAMKSTLSNTGGALIISAVTTIAGFGVLLIADIPLLQDFGAITASMMIFSLIFAVVVLPIPLAGWAVIKRKKGMGPKSTNLSTATGGPEKHLDQDVKKISDSEAGPDQPERL